MHEQEAKRSVDDDGVGVERGCWVVEAAEAAVRRGSKGRRKVGRIL